MLPGAQVLSGTSTHEDPSPYMMVQKEPLVVEGGGVVEVVSLLVVVVEVEEASELVVGSIVIVVIDVSDAVVSQLAPFLVANGGPGFTPMPKAFGGLNFSPANWLELQFVPTTGPPS